MDYERTLEARLVIRRLCHPVTCPDPTPPISESWPRGCRESWAHLGLAAAHASWDAGGQRSPVSLGLKFSSDKDQLFALVLWEKWMSVAACHQRAKNGENMFLPAPRWCKFWGMVALQKLILPKKRRVVMGHFRRVFLPGLFAAGWQDSCLQSSAVKGGIKNRTCMFYSSISFFVSGNKNNVKGGRNVFLCSWRPRFVFLHLCSASWICFKCNFPLIAGPFSRSLNSSVCGALSVCGVRLSFLSFPAYIWQCDAQRLSWCKTSVSTLVSAGVLKVCQSVGPAVRCSWPVSPSMSCAYCYRSAINTELLRK